MYETIVQVGVHPITVKNTNFRKFLEEVSALQALNVATEGKPHCYLFHAKRGHDFYGFRDMDPNSPDFKKEVKFGNGGDEGPAGGLFAYRPGYVNENNPSSRYEGFLSWEEIKARKATVGGGQPAAYAAAPAQPAAAPAPTQPAYAAPAAPVGPPAITAPPGA